MWDLLPSDVFSGSILSSFKSAKNLCLHINCGGLCLHINCAGLCLHINCAGCSEGFHADVASVGVDKLSVAFCRSKVEHCTTCVADAVLA